MAMSGRCRRCAASVSVLMWASVPTSGQLVEESFSLQRGWNSVFLEVDPIPERANDLFASEPFEAVWTPADPASINGPPLDCLGPDDPDCAPAGGSAWRVWIPTAADGTCDENTDMCEGGPNAGNACANDQDCAVDAAGRALRLAVSLHAVRGGRAYLIKAERAAIWTVVGKPNSLRTRWQAGFNFTGFHVDPESPPSFSAYLAPSPVHTNAAVFQKPLTQEEQPNGELHQVNPDTPIVPSRAYWVTANADHVYDGPLSIDRLTLGGIDFQRNQARHSITVENEAGVQREVSIQFFTQDPAPSIPEGFPLDAGEVPFIWRRYEDVNATEDLTALENVFEWVALDSESLMSTFGPNSESGARQAFNVAVDRLATTQTATLEDEPPAQYQSVLSITDGVGYRRLIAVVAQVPARHGLWTGSVTLNEVRWNTADALRWTNAEEFSCGCEDGFCQLGPNASELCNTQADCECPDASFESQNDPNPGGAEAFRPTAVGAELSFRVIMHLSEAEEWKLLSAITLLFEPDGSEDPTSGQFVLATPSCDPSFCDGLKPGSIVDGSPFAPRFSTAGYAIDQDLGLAAVGSFPTRDLEIVGAIVLDPTHRLNPFFHQFHPDHDCDVVGECFKVARSFRFIQDLNPPMGITDPRWGFSTITGEYVERVTISGKPFVSACGCRPVGTCVGPPNNGQPCEALPDCAPGDCTFEDICVGGGENDGEACTDDADCGCPATCTCDENQVCHDMDEESSLPTEGAACVTDADCGCDDENTYSTDVRGRFTLTRVSEISVLNGGHSQ